MNSLDSIAMLPLMANALSGPNCYQFDSAISPHSKKNRGVPVGCSLCGATRITLRKDGAGGMICDRCREAGRDKA